MTEQVNCALMLMSSASVSGRSQVKQNVFLSKTSELLQLVVASSRCVCPHCGSALGEVGDHLWYWRHTFIWLKGIKVQVEKGFSRTFVGLRTTTCLQHVNTS